MKKTLLLICFFIFSISFSQVNAQFFEGFENTTGADPLPSTNWTLGSGNWIVFDNGIGISKRWEINNTVATPPLVRTGANAAYVNREEIGQGNTSEDYLATPIIYFDVNSALRFYSRTFTSGNQSTIYQIKICSANAVPNTPSSYTTIAEFTEDQISSNYNIYQEIVINIPTVYYGQSGRIAFVKKHTQLSGIIEGDRWFIDDVSLFNNTSYPTPTNLSATNITNTSAIINWTENNSATTWEIEIAPFSLQFTGVGVIYSNSIPTYLLTGLSPGTCNSFRVRSLINPFTSSPWSQPINFCLISCVNNATCPEGLELVAFYDTNNNGIKDASETNFNNGNFVYQVNSGTPLYGNTNNGSFLIFENNPTNIYNLSFAVDSNFTSYYNSSATFTNITVPTGSGSNTYYFPITQLQPYNDLEVLLVPNGVPRPGFIHNNTLYYKNKGGQTVASGTVTFTKSVNVSIVSNSQSGVVSNPTGFSYTFTNLLPNEQRFIQVGLQVPTIPTVALGDVVTNSATVTPLSGDAIPTDNAATLSQIIVGSYDPNDKTESYGGKIVYSNFTSNDYLTYTIQFENTGTANAEFIRVEDLLNASLDKNSIVMLNSSHSYDMRRIDNKLIWNFYNINLPPTSTNPAQSHGFIQFKIKPTPGYAVGTIIPNSAEIYFDYNPPIYTNTFNTEFVQALKNTSFTNSEFVLYPNPASDFVQINLKNDSEKIKSIVIYDVVGKIVKTVNDVNSSETKVITSDFSKGLYLIEITNEANLKQVKKLVIK